MTEIGGPNGRFSPTLWTIVRRAVDREHPGARDAMQTLVERYWKPVYFYIRRRGHDPESAKDVTQAFFCHVLEKGGLEGVDPAKGRFRTYLLGALNFFLARQAEAKGAAKRGGGRQILSLDYKRAESDYAIEPASDETPERTFDLAWARVVLNSALERLKAELEEEGKPEYYRVLQLALGPDKMSYVDIAQVLGISTSDVTNFLHRAKQRYRRALIAAVMPSVGSLADAEAEIAALFEALS